MCIISHFHFPSVSLKQSTSCYIESNFFGFCWVRWVIFSLVFMLTDLIIRCRLRHVLMKFSCSQYEGFLQPPVVTTFEMHAYAALIFINTFLGLCFVHDIEFEEKKLYLSVVTFWLTFLKPFQFSRDYLKLTTCASTYFFVHMRDHWRLDSVWFITIANGRFSVKHTCIKESTESFVVYIQPGVNRNS